MAQNGPDRKEERGAQEGVKDHATPTGVKEGFSNSEHALEVSGMRHTPDERERRRESYSKADIDEDVVVSEPTYLKKSALEERVDEEAREKGGRLIRQAGSGSLHDELDHTAGEDEDRKG